MVPNQTAIFPPKKYLALALLLCALLSLTNSQCFVKPQTYGEKKGIIHTERHKVYSLCTHINIEKCS